MLKCAFSPHPNTCNKKHAEQHFQNTLLNQLNKPTLTQFICNVDSQTALFYFK